MKPCPICGAEVSRDPPAPPAKSYYPFCSERCKLIDFGRWMTGQYAIPGEPVQPPEPEPPKEG